MLTRSWNRIVAMMLACIMMFAVLPVGAIAEEPVVDDQDVITTDDTQQPAEPTEAEKLIAKIDNLLVRYLGDQFKGGDKTNEEILAEVNQLSRSQINTIVNGLEDNRFDRLVAEVANLRDAIADLLSADRAACNGRGVFGALCDATDARKNSAESAELIAARDAINSMNAKYGNANVMSMGPDDLKALISAISSMIMKVEHLDAVDRPAVEAQYGATIDALSDVMYAAEERLGEIDALMAFFAAGEMFGAKYNVMADPMILAEGMKYYELLDCKAEIKALESIINGLNPADAAAYGHLITFIADLKDAVQVRLDDLGPKLHSDSQRRDLLPLLEEAKEIYCLPYTEEDLWIKLETKVALILQSEDPSVAFAAIEKIVTTYEQLMDNHKEMIDEEYGAEIVFLTELYADLAEIAANPLTMQSRGGRFDTDVTGNYYTILSEKDYNIISGVTETEIVMNNSDGSRRQLFRFFTIDPTSSALQIVPGYYQIDKYASDPTNTAYQNAAKVTDMAAYYESNLGYDIVGGMNTALAYDSNAPYSFLMWEGTVLQDKNDSFDLGYDWLNQHTGSCATYIAIKKDGTVELRGSSEPFEADDWNCIGANFGWLVKDGALVSTTVERTSAAASRSMIGIKEDGTLILCQTDGRDGNTSVGQSNYEMGEMMLALGCQWAFNCDGGGSSTFISQRAGETGLTMRSKPSDGSERPTILAIFVAKAKGMTPGVFDFALIGSEYDYFAPHTTYTFTVEAIDTTGAVMEMPEGGVWSLSDDSFGTITDGIFVSNGTLGAVVVQYTVGGKTAEYPITVVHPDSFAFGADGTVIPYGKSVTLTPTVLYGVDNWDVYYQADTFTWTFSDETVGTWDPATLTYTASSDESVQGPVLTLTYKHSDTLAAVTYELEFGKGSEIVAGWDFENGDVSDWMGFSDAKAWSIANGVNNTLVGSDPLAGQFSPENDAHTFLATRSNGQVKNGNYALGITYDNSNSSFANWTYNVLFNVGEVRVFRDVANGLNATTLGFWLYIPEGAAGLAFQSQFNSSPDHSAPTCKQDHFMFTTVSGARKSLNQCTEADIPANRWVYASIDISNYDYLSTMPPMDETNSRSPSWMRTYIKPGAPHELTFYIDDITLDYSSAVEDRIAPVIENATYTLADEGAALTDGVTIGGNSVNFTAAISDKGEGLNLATAKIYIDGVEVETEATKTAMATKANVELENGQHRVTFEIEDNWYNRTQLSFEITIEGTVDALAVLSGHNDSGNVPEADSVYYVDIKAPAAENVAKIEATIQLNTANTWEIENMIVASGFTAEYTMLEGDRTLTATARSNTDIHSVENAVRLTLTRNEDCTLTGEQMLVSIPVRVWSWDGYNNVTEADEPVPGNIPTVTIDFTILSGIVENMAGEATSFGGDKSVATAMKGQMAAEGYVYHVHTAAALEDKAATCTENGYTGRTYCEGCGSVIEWGEIVPATGHDYDYATGILNCTTCGELNSITGLIEANGRNYYAVAGKLQNKWHLIDDTWYYFNYEQYYGLNGEYPIQDYFFHPIEGKFAFVQGKLVSGIWYEMDGGWRYYYGPSYHVNGWKTIDGAQYYFTKDGYRLTGHQTIVLNPNSSTPVYQHFLFDENGVSQGLYTGFYNGTYFKDGAGYAAGMALIDGSIYYIKAGGWVVRDTSRYVSTEEITEGVKALGYGAGVYEFDADGRLIDNTKNGIIGAYYYIDGVVQKTGLTKVDDAFYFFDMETGLMACSSTVEVTADDIDSSASTMTAGTYSFDADGKMIAKEEPEQPPVEEEKFTGIRGNYYYVDDVMQKPGLILVDGDIYYFNRSSGVMYRNGTRWVTAAEIEVATAEACYMAGSYTFGSDGKAVLLDGIVNGTYYDNGARVAAGLIVLDGSIYYIKAGGWVVSGCARYVTTAEISDELKEQGIKAGTYTFAADGKMEYEGTLKKNGIIGDYYYINDEIQKTGLTKVSGDFYFFDTATGLMVRNSTVDVTADAIHDSAAEKNAGTYIFGADGKMTGMVNPEPEQPPVTEKFTGIKDNYYYIDDVMQKPGLILVDGDIYYFSTSSGKMYCDGTRWVTADTIEAETAAAGYMAGSYTFGADGKAELLNGIVNGTYYDNGARIAAGLIRLDGNIYYIKAGGWVVNGCSRYVSSYEISQELADEGFAAGVYTFATDGTLVQ